MHMSSSERHGAAIIHESFRKLKALSFFTPVLTLAIIVALFAVGSGGKNISLTNFVNIIVLSSVFLIAVQGMTMVFLIGGMDLSTEGIMALSAVVSGLLAIRFPHSILLIFMVAVGIGFLAGMLSGIIHSRLKMPSFLVTLGMWYVARGLSVIIIQGEQFPVKSPELKYLVDGRVLGFIPVITLIAISITLVFMLIQRKTRIGKYAYAIGGNEQLAIQAGVNTECIKPIVFGLAGATYAIVGFFLMARLQLTTSQIGTDYMFPVVIAAVLGGTAMSGGYGGAVNAVIGAIAYQFLQNGMILINLNVFAQSAVNGVVLIAAVTLSMDRKKIGIIK